MELLAVICPLDIAADDRAWIEGLRAQHDPQHDLVAAHFTLVFPMADVSASRLARHVEQIASHTAAIGFQLSSARAVRDRFAPRSHVFLTPDEGDAEIRRLHGILYGGELSSSLRKDVPYHPHVTVAAVDTHSAAETLGHELGEFRISGSLRSLALMSVDERAITQRRLFPLQ